MEELQKLSEGEKLSSSEEKKVLAMTARHNVTVDEAVALFLWSVSSPPIQYSITNNTDTYISGVLRTLEQQLTQKVLLQKEKEALLGLVRSMIPTMKRNCLKSKCYKESLIKHSKHLQTFYEAGRIATAQRKDVRVSVLSAIRKINIATSATLIVPLIHSAIKKHKNDEPLTVYRAMKQETDGTHLENKGFMSASKTKESSFAKYDTYKFVMEIHVPKNTPCMDISEFSAYDNVEKEILFLSNIICLSDKKSQEGRIYATGQLRSL